MNKFKFGIIREEKVPPDSRVPFTPKQCKELLEKFPNIELKVERSPNRCYTDAEYEAEGISLSENVNDCDILFGVKEVPKPKLIANKKYFFFSHTIKKQPYNKELLQKIIAKNIQLIDYECLRWERGSRIIGFGRFAGIVGAHNGLMTLGERLGAFELKAAHKSKDYDEIKQAYKALKIPPVKMLITGGGRVALGAKEVLDELKIKEVSPEAYLNQSFNEPVYVILDVEKLYRKKGHDGDFDRPDFYKNPSDYESTFAPYTKVTDFMINGVYWSNEAPIFFSKADMRAPDFKIKTIADVTCDIEGSIPATLKATVIGDPVFGYNPHTEQETDAYQDQVIDIMSIDNLPNELPRDASAMFGEALIAHVIPELIKAEESNIIHRASITKNGDLNEPYEYLRDYVS